MNLWERTDRVVIDITEQLGKKAQEGAALSLPQLCDRAMAVYRGRHQGLIDEALRSMFTPENFMSLRLFTHTATNILERVLDETAIVYQEPATRWLKGQGKERRTASGRVGDLLNKTDRELTQPAPVDGAEPVDGPVDTQDGDPGELGDQEGGFEAYLKALDLDAIFQEAQRLARLPPGVVWLRPVVRKGDSGGLELRVDLYTLAAANVVVDPADKTRALAWYTWRDEVSAEARSLIPGRSQAQTRRVYYLWTDEKFEKYDSDWKKIANDLQPDEVNPLGRLPVVTLRLGDPLDGYYLDGKGQDLVDSTIEVCVLRTLQNARYRDSSFKQTVIDGDPEKVPADQVMGNPALPIYVGEGGSASVLDLQANLEQMSAISKEREQSIAVKYGVSPSSWSMSEKAQSGFSKRMDVAKVTALNRRERKFLARAEADLYALCARMSGTGTPLPQGIDSLDETAEYVVDFMDPQFEEPAGEQARTDSQRITLGIENVLDLVLRDNPDMTEEEGIEQLALNRAINARFLDKKGRALLDLLALPQGTNAPTPPPAPGAPKAPGEPPQPTDGQPKPNPFAKPAPGGDSSAA